MDGTAERSLHNFILHSQLKWGRQKHLRCVKSSHTSSSTSASPSPKKTPKGKLTMHSATIIASGRGDTTTDIEAVREKLVTDLKVTIDNHLKLRMFDDQEKEKKSHKYRREDNKKPFEEGLPWNLRSRLAIGKAGHGVSNVGLSPAMLQSQKWNGGEASKSLGGLQRPKFSATLSNEEIETDFLLMTGANPPRRPKKRSRSLQKSLQKHLDRLFPGSWLNVITPESYKVLEHLEPKQADK
ncbi:uncharacterized protein [Coffea arabica]|uniref:Uncharacterized protein n=1 Tax=Coffea arabica TaxID=13443 RepID=A0A6P6XAU9_COFAR|nr:uncharacterized protein LOC113741548 [Coffea arabica]